jgi:hypothetical protein
METLYIFCIVPARRRADGFESTIDYDMTPPAPMPANPASGITLTRLHADTWLINAAPIAGRHIYVWEFALASQLFG